MTKSHGGARAGAGRPRRYTEPVVHVRIPRSKADAVRAYLSGHTASTRDTDGPSLLDIRPAAASPAHRPLPVVDSPRVQAGFPSPAADYVQDALDLNELLVRNQTATFFARVSGDSLIDARIHDGDIVVVDRSLRPRSGQIVVVSADGDLYIKRLELRAGHPWLVSENRARAAELPPMDLHRFQDYTIWGVVTGCVRRF
ncbi:MAG: translesion error-prone DNA polymerase V autoproteolytic subunit [Nevskiaceae bacterium]|nr:MAG: translesion error-prone DNA polymerase V autoproteolytic subunit [Nevskiaceae bacterium]